MRRIIIIITALALIAIIGAGIYFVAGVSATYPPISEYEFSGNANQFLSGIRFYTANNPNITFKVTDITGAKNTGYATYFNIEIKEEKSDVLYNLKCENKGDDKNATTTSIHLIGAFNAKNYKEGGYGINGIGVKNMVDKFNKTLLPDLKRSQKMFIKPI